MTTEAHSTLNRELVDQLKAIPIFADYWSESLETCLSSDLQLTYQPTDSIPYYQTSLAFDLKPIASAPPEGADITVACTLIFTSAGSLFTCDRVRKHYGTTEHPAIGPSISVQVEVKARSSLLHACLRKTLWNDSPAWVEGHTELVARLLGPPSPSAATGIAG
ncbi:MAG: hypothetical protein ABSH47_20190 [Bryobacteraceae bacterium]|jgi:hypothetical protein